MSSTAKLIRLSNRIGKAKGAEKVKVIRETIAVLEEMRRNNDLVYLLQHATFDEKIEELKAKLKAMEASP